ncbi:hypothetical protein [uncultured Algimonas sp.]|uniref:hypothetical protein n=1 Tax=uncultured Algimonas sp. TaxID=1547920 RepID=UPI00263311D9|nr:hypothetical protein [uncultured Algimonas sp.]
MNTIPFRSLGKYDWPSTPVNRGLDRLREAVRPLLNRGDASGIDTGRLERPSQALLDDLSEPPAHQPVVSELDATLSGWLDAPENGPRHQTIVLPPCDREDLLGRWAGDRGLPVFGLDRGVGELDALDTASAEPLVVPKLERHFLRTRDGLVRMRILIDRMARMERSLIVGCNSWAWQFLRKSCEIDLVFSDPVTFRAYDRERLRAWLGTLAHAPADETALCFRAAATGRDVFGNGDGEAEVSSFMTDLAKRSLGIPWVAWHLWRDSLRTEIPIHDDEDAMRDCKPNTLWVAELQSPSVPSRSDQNALLILHALLIHGGLTDDQIVQTVPLVTYTNVLSSLLRGGLIDETDGLYRCHPAAYPAVRDGLKNNGYPVDVL